ncbi:MAG: J domain-containing protein [Chloroflexi bacterium]|nr:J domain-containing protein [Chloroflexota bacterium]MCL5273859.1 J domain-containing protein [Chloroflexota bacterium]
MDYKDYYKILGVDRNADADAIKKAFRKLARQYHPDVNKGDKNSENRFKEINEANDVLSDPEKRKLYDQLGANYQQYRQSGGDPRSYDWSQWAQQGGGGFRGRPGTTSTEEVDFSDLIDSLFGERFGGRQTARRPRDLQQPVEISLAEAFRGATRVLSKDGQDIEVTIPAGVKTGSKVRVKGQGARNSRGQAGDLYLVIEVARDDTYERQDDDLTRDVRVDAFTAMLGGEVTVQTLSGSVVVTVPPGTSSGKKIRLRGKGMPKLNAKGEQGDLYLRIVVTVPRELNPEDRLALEKIAKHYR